MVRGADSPGLTFLSVKFCFNEALFPGQDLPAEE